MHPVAEALAQQFISDFWSADHELEWTAIEQERHLWLDPQTLLIGRVDAQGRTPNGEPFFGDWKTASASKAGKRMVDTKTMWRTDPQALTYGVLLSGPVHNEHVDNGVRSPCTCRVRTFTVRWAIKTTKPQTDFEWYTYTQAEIDQWTLQLLGIAREIRMWRNRQMIPTLGDTWRTNRGSCYRFGVSYACPFVADCPNHQPHDHPRVPHSELERQVKEGDVGLLWSPGDIPPGYDDAHERMRNLVVLSSSRVGDYLACPEMYRMKWEGDGFSEENENLTIGTDFHTLIASHLKPLVKETKWLPKN